MKTMLGAKRYQSIARVSIFSIVVAVIAAMMGCTSTQGDLTPFRSIGTRVTSMAESSENTITYDGDLIIDGYEEFLIENCTWIQKGNIISVNVNQLIPFKFLKNPDTGFFTEPYCLSKFGP